MPVTPRHLRPGTSIFHEQRFLFVLMGVMIIIFLIQLFLGPEIIADWMVVPLKIENALVAIRSGNGDAGSWQALATMLTYGFLHMDLDHIVGNLLFLWIFAGLARRLIHEAWIPVLFAMTAIAGSAMHVFLNRGDVIPMLGASGAVMGFEGLYLGLSTRGKLPDAFIWPLSRPISPVELLIVALVGVGFDYFNLMAGSGLNVAFGAHLGGFAMGLLLGTFVVPRPTVEGPMRQRWR
ncbi:MAG: rhomboid family intramembrane serine protease [Verrucomicrobiales bacterium]